MFTLSVVTPEKVVLEEQVESIVAPGTEGYLGVLTDHAPLVTGLVPGKLVVKSAGGTEKVYALSGGFLEVSNNVATILADAVEGADELDVERARQALERAKKRLEIRYEIDVDRALAAKRRAENRLKLASQYR